MTRLQQEAHRKDFQDWSDNMSFKLFLLERELGYMITPDTNGLAFVERLKMFDRYVEEKNKVDTPSKKGNKSAKLMK